MSSGGGGNDFEKRLTRLEACFENITTVLTEMRSDIRLLLGGGIGGAILLFGAIATSHLILNAQDGVILEKLSSLEARTGERFGRLENSMNTLESSMNTLESRMTLLEDNSAERFSRIEASLAVLLARSEDREAEEQGPPSAGRDARNSSRRRETLH